MSAAPSHIRPATRGDLPEVVDLLNACDVAEVGEPDTAADDVESDWGMEGFELARDAWVVVADDDPRVAGELEALHAPVALDVVGRRVGFSDLGDVAGVEQVDDLGQVAARGRSDVAGGGAHGAMVRELVVLDENDGGPGVLGHHRAADWGALHLHLCLLYTS